MAVTVLGLAGSPRRKGNTETLLDWTLAAAEAAGAEVVKLRIRELGVAGCLACDGCAETGVCIVNDGMDRIFPHLRSADSIALAAPIFSMGMAAQAKAMVDRCQAFWALKFLLKQPVRPEGSMERRGTFISCAGTTYTTVFDGAQQVAKYFWHVLDVRPIGDLLCPGVDGKGEILQYPNAREIAEDIGRRLAEPR
jgi:multimeric flavodoxin WrbA